MFEHVGCMKRIEESLDLLNIEADSKQAYNNQLKYFLDWLKNEGLNLENGTSPDLDRYLAIKGFAYMVQ